MTTSWVLLLFTSCLAVVVVRSKASWGHRLALNSVAVLDAMLDTGDEDAKLAALEQATTRLIKSLFAFVGLLAVGLLVLLAPWKLAVQLPWSMLTTWSHVLSLSLGGTAGLVVPMGRQAVSGHAPLDQLWHRMVLNHPNVHLWLMRRDIAAWQRQGGTPKPGFLLITGLARSGTTSVLERLASSNRFHSLGYANMPLVLAPNLWKRFYNPKGGEKRERSHGDGIMVGLDSAEALEEVFFQAITRREYCASQALETHDLTEDQHDTYLAYQGTALAAGDATDAMYVAKNNNALLRYRALRRMNREFHAVVMFRDPLTHAASLLAMHKKYCTMQSDEPFVLEYMNWLAHHEFGLGHKPFQFSTTTQLPTEDPNTLDHWLRLWINHHQEVLALDNHRLHLVSYEAYCAHPQAVLQAIVEETHMDARMEAYPAYTKVRPVDHDASPALLEEARRIHQALLAQQLPSIQSQS